MAVLRCMIPLAIIGCTGAESGVAPIAGTITSGESAGVMTTGIAYAAELGGEILFAVFPNADATCDDAGAELTPGDPDWNSDAVQVPGACTLIVLAPYTGGISLTDATIVDATVTLNCAMDDGEWEYRDSALYDEGYYYTGPWWQGSPDVYSLEITGSEADGYALSISMESYSGQFIYDFDNPETDPATGSVSGAASATYCDQLIGGF